MKIYSIGEFSKLTGYAMQTLRNWDYNDTLKPYSVSKGGKRFYSEEQLNTILGRSNKVEKVILGYCRVSSDEQEEELERQIDSMTIYLTAQGKPFEIISDIGIGVDYSNEGLRQIISKLNSGVVEKVVVLYKDSLVSFGFEIIEYLAELNDATIEVVEPKKESKQEEVVTDLVQVLDVFSTRLQGSLANKVKDMIEMIEEGEIDGE